MPLCKRKCKDKRERIGVGRNRLSVKDKLYNETMVMAGENQHVIHCCTCLTPDNLQMLPHKHPTGLIIGWMFVCKKCRESIENCEITMKWKQRVDTVDSN